MPDPLTGYEATSVADVESFLDDNPAASSDEVYLGTVGHSERAIAAVAAKRVGAGGRGSLPDPITEPVTITPTAGMATDSLRVNAATNDSWVRIGDVEGATLAVNGAGQESLSVLSEAQADEYVQMMDVESADGVVLSLYTDGQADVTLYQSDTNGFRVVNNASPGQPLFRCAIAGLLFRFNAAPADSDLSAGDCALWFDKTDGAASLNVKAKSANGTVVTGSLALT